MRSAHLLPLSIGGKGRCFHSIPVVDVGPLLRRSESDELAKSRAVDDLHHACTTVGFCSIVNHGVDPKLCAEVLGQARKFFAQPQEIKDDISIAKSPTFRGYQRLMENVTKGERDMHEAIDFHRELTAEDAHASEITVRLHGTNQWPSPEAVPGFRKTYEQYTEEMLELGAAVMRGVALGLELPETHFEPYYSNSYWLFRVIRYPSVEVDHSSAGLGCGEHTDYGCLTIICSDGTPNALQVRNKQGEWITAEPVDGSFLMNIGDMLQLWTNGLYKSTPHRVLFPPTERVSVPFFFEPNYDAQVSPITTAAGHETGAVYYGEHLEKKVFSNFDL